MKFTQYVMDLKSDKSHGRFMALSKLFLHERATPAFQDVILVQLKMVQLPPTVMEYDDAMLASQHGVGPGQIIVKRN